MPDFVIKATLIEKDWAWLSSSSIAVSILNDEPDRWQEALSAVRLPKE